MINFMGSDYLKTLMKEKIDIETKNTLDSINVKLVKSNNTDNKGLEKIALLSYLFS